MVPCLGEPPRKFLLLLIFTSFLIFISFLYLHFTVDLHFVVVLHLSMFFIHICFSTSSLTLPWTIAEFLHPFHTFSPSQSDWPHFHFQPFRYFFTASATVLSEHFFYPQAFFTLRSLTNILTYVYQGLPGSWQFFFEVCKGFILILFV